MEAIYRLFTLRPQVTWGQLDLVEQQKLLDEIQHCWQHLGGQLIVEHPMARYSADVTWLAFGIAGELNLSALQSLLAEMTEHGWNKFVTCEVPVFLHVDSTPDLHYN